MDTRLVDFNKPVDIELNGATATRRFAPSLKTLCETLARRGDPAFAFSAEFTVAKDPNGRLVVQTGCQVMTLCRRMKQFLSTLPRNILGCFKGRMIIWHVFAIVLTFILVTSGFDWLYFTSTRNPILRSWMFPAAPIGGLVPIVLPLILLTIGSISRSAKTTLAGWAVGQAELIGALIAAAYKSLTGRVHPSHGVGADISHIFRFGFLRGGVFWGWPSSHTTIAFAMAVSRIHALSETEGGWGMWRSPTPSTSASASP